MLSLYYGRFDEGEVCLCLVCYSDRDNKCYLRSCDCDSELQYTRPDYLEIRDHHSTYKTWFSRYGHWLDRTWYYSYYSKEHFNWTDSLEANRNSMSYTNSSQLIEKLRGGVYLPATIWSSGYKYGYDHYWIGLGVVTCRDGMLD